MKIIIGADVVPTPTNDSLFSKGDVSALVGQELAEILHSADYRIFNLEVPLTDKSSPIDKNGPSLIAPVSTVNGFRAIGADMFTLANNHILDQGEQGLDSTVKALKENNIAYAGAGKNINEARKPYIFETEGLKIGVFCCAEHEFSVSKDDKPGVNPFDSSDSPDCVAELKSRCDYVIVLYHGGKEHYRYPSPGLQKACRKFMDKGADIVVCQHSHCIGCEEKYLNGTIVYGQGNFIFDHSNNEFWKTGMLISIDEKFSISYIPVVKQNESVRLADESKAKEILNEFYNRSEEIKAPGVIEKKYSEFADTMLINYLYALSGKKSFPFRVFDKLTGHRYSTWLLKRKYNKKSRLILQNYIECEAHRELLLAGLHNYKY